MAGIRSPDAFFSAEPEPVFRQLSGYAGIFAGA